MTMISRRAVAGLAAAAIAGIAFAGPAAAQQEWPKAKPVTFVVPWGAGTASDVITRVLADELEKKYKQTFIVENRAGATGSIGQAHVARQAPDGYTLIVTTPGPAANNKNTFTNLPYDPLKDFTNITRLYVTELAIMASNELKANNLKELIEHAKANPGKVNAGNPGFGTYAHMAEVTFADMVGVEFNIVPYKSGVDDLPDLYSGRIDIMMNFIGNYVEPGKAKKLKVLGIASEKRSAQFPDVPTFKEQGFNFAAEAWNGLQGPAGMNPDLVKKINADVVEIMNNNPRMKQALTNISAIAATTTPEEFHKMIIAEEAMWRPTIAKYNIRSQ